MNPGPHSSKFCGTPFHVNHPCKQGLTQGIPEGLNNLFKYEDGCVRYLDKDSNAGERQLYSGWYKEQICQFGTGIKYQRASTDLSDYDPLYGESSTQTFGTPIDLVVYMELNENALTLQQFGLQSDDDITIFVHIETFYEAMGGTGNPWTDTSGIEPNAGDIFRLEEYGNDRVYPRKGNVYEVTQRIDQDIQAKLNPLLGHYIWMLKGKRHDYSFEQNVEPEGGQRMVDEDSIYDPYLQNAETWSTIRPKEIFDYGDYGGGDAVYGDYY
jgi:hypothetical protein